MEAFLDHLALGFSVAFTAQNLGLAFLGCLIGTLVGVLPGIPQIQAGTIKAYAVALPERSPALPDVPTTREAGLPELQVTAWNAIFAPKGTPPEIVKRLSGALLQALADAGTRKRLLDLGADLSLTSAQTPDGLQRLVESEVLRWNKVLKPAAK